MHPICTLNGKEIGDTNHMNYTHYYKMCPSSLLVSLDFEWIWTFLPREIV
jgi:hypothetical protein